MQAGSVLTNGRGKVNLISRLDHSFLETDGAGLNRLDALPVPQPTASKH